MTKKLIATALASAFSLSAMAAEVSISGDYEFSMQSSNGTDTANTDGDFNIKATEELDNGMTVSTDFNINASGENDGSNSLTIKGDFGKFDLGDTSSATDAIDDATDWGYVLTEGTSNPDHSVLYTTPSFGGVTANFSYAAPDGNPDGNAGGHGASVRYKGEMFTVGYGQVEQRDGVEYALVNGTVGLGGIDLAAEKVTKTSATNVDTDYTTLGATYSVDKITLGVETAKTESAGTTSADLLTYGVHYNVAGGLTAFAEFQQDDQDEDADTTAVGLAFTF